MNYELLVDFTGCILTQMSFSFLTTFTQASICDRQNDDGALCDVIKLVEVEIQQIDHKFQTSRLIGVLIQSVFLHSVILWFKYQVLQ